MKIKLIWIGKTAEDYLNQGIQIYFNRLQHYCRFEIQEIIIPKKFNNLPPEVLKKKESEAVISHITNQSKLYLLDEKGKEFTSIGLANFIEKNQIAGSQELVLVIGGAFGFHQDLYEKADGKLSFSKLTFSHQMIRLFVAEQIYRAFTIIKGEAYHNE